MSLHYGAQTTHSEDEKAVLCVLSVEYAGAIAVLWSRDFKEMRGGLC